MSSLQQGPVPLVLEVKETLVLFNPLCCIFQLFLKYPVWGINTAYFNIFCPLETHRESNSNSDIFSNQNATLTAKTGCVNNRSYGLMSYMKADTWEWKGKRQERQGGKVHQESPHSETCFLSGYTCIVHVNISQKVNKWVFRLFWPEWFVGVFFCEDCCGCF